MAEMISKKKREQADKALNNDFEIVDQE